MIKTPYNGRKKIYFKKYRQGFDQLISERKPSNRKDLDTSL